MKTRYANIISRYKQRFNGKGGIVALAFIVGTFGSFLLGIFNPAVANKAGPDWLWGGGRHDLIRSLYFRPNGTFRRYGRAALVATLCGGSLALYALLQPL